MQYVQSSPPSVPGRSKSSPFRLRVMSAVEMPDQRINSAIPEAKQRIRVEGITAILTVEKVEETSLLDGVGKPVYNIFVKGPNGAITAMLERRYVHSQEKYDIIDDDATVAKCSLNADTEWIEIDDSVDCGKGVRKWFPSTGWYNGKVISKARNYDSSKNMYKVEYTDGDTEDLDDNEFADATRYHEGQLTEPLPLLLAIEAAEKAALAAASSSSSAPLVSLIATADSEDRVCINKTDARESPPRSEPIPPIQAADLTASAKAARTLETDESEQEQEQDDDSMGRCPQLDDILASSPIGDGTDHSSSSTCTSIVPYTQGERKTIAELVCLGNNARFMFDNPFTGEESYNAIRSEDGTHNKTRTIVTQNSGGVLIIPCTRDCHKLTFTFAFNQGPTTMMAKNVPSFHLAFAEMAITKKELVEGSSLIRGKVYQSKHRFDDKPAVYLLHTILIETGDKFFNGNRAIVSLMSASAPTKLICINKTAIDKKSVYGDYDVMAVLGITSEIEWKTVVQACELDFSNWMEDPIFNNEFARQVVRPYGAYGADYIEDLSIESAKPDAGQQIEFPEEQSQSYDSKPMKIRRVRSSGSANKDSKVRRGDVTDHEWDVTKEVFSNEDAYNDEVTVDSVPNKPKKRHPKAAKLERGTSTAMTLARDAVPFPQEVTRSVKMLSPNSAQVLVEAAVAIKTVELQKIMLSRADDATERFSMINREMLKESKDFAERQLKQHDTYLDRLASESSKTRVNEAFTRFDNPTQTQAGMFSLLVGSTAASMPSLQRPQSASTIEPAYTQPSPGFLTLEASSSSNIDTGNYFSFLSRAIYDLNSESHIRPGAVVQLSLERKMQNLKRNYEKFKGTDFEMTAGEYKAAIASLMASE